MKKTSSLYGIGLVSLLISFYLLPDLVYHYNTSTPFLGALLLSLLVAYAFTYPALKTMKAGGLDLFLRVLWVCLNAGAYFYCLLAYQQDKPMEVILNNRYQGAAHFVELWYCWMAVQAVLTPLIEKFFKKDLDQIREEEKEKREKRRREWEDKFKKNSK